MPDETDTGSAIMAPIVSGSASKMVCLKFLGKPVSESFLVLPRKRSIGPAGMTDLQRKTHGDSEAVMQILGSTQSRSCNG